VVLSEICKHCGRRLGLSSKGHHGWVHMWSGASHCHPSSLQDIGIHGIPVDEGVAMVMGER